MDGDGIALIGFGEAASAIVAGWPAGVSLAAYDVKSEEPAAAGAMAERLAAHRVRLAASPADALSGAAAALCLVTADRALEAAEAGARHLAPGALWLDGNSCAPGTKARAARVVGPGYVDMAIMAPVSGLGHRVPVLLSGPSAERAASRLRGLGMAPEVVGDAVGQASSVKMLRSAMIKGLEALTAECILGARRAGVDGRVLASLMASDPEVDWPARAAYNLERMTTHGNRRAAEMREVALTLREIGVPDAMAAATEQWQARLGAMGETLEAHEDLGARADRLLGRL